MTNRKYAVFSLFLLLEASALAQTFGYGRLKLGATPETIVSRPLLVILVEFSDRRFASNHTPDFYRRVFFGPTFPNAAAYFSENSGGRFTVAEAGVVGPYQMPNNPATTSDESQMNCGPWARDASNRQTCPDSTRSEQRDRAAAVRLAAQNGFDFRRYANRDGRVTDNELLVLVVFASPNNCGANRGFDPWPIQLAAGRSPLYFAVGSAGAFDENADFATMVHEVSHSFGTWDLYGPWNDRWYSMSPGATLMGATCNGIDRRWTVHFDAWHKVQLGWQQPRVVATNGPTTCHYLDPAHQGGATPGANRAPILLWDPARGPREYFLFEYRSPSRAEQPEGNGIAPSTRYDADVADNGLAVWYVKESADGNLTQQIITVERADSRPANTATTLQTAARAGSDDQVIDFDGDGVSDAVMWGGDLLLQSTKSATSTDVEAGGNTAYLFSPMTLPGSTDPRASAVFNRSQFFRRVNDGFKLFWPGNTDSGVRVYLGADGSTPLAVRLATASAARSGTAQCFTDSTPPPDAYPAPRVSFDPSCLTRVAAPTFEYRGVNIPGPTLSAFATVRVDLMRATTDAAATVELRVRSGNATPAIQTATVAVGAREASFRLTITGRNPYEDVEVEARVRRVVGVRRTVQTDIATATLRVTPPSRPAGDPRVTCAEMAALERKLKVYKYLIWPMRSFKPQPGPDPFIRIDPAVLSANKGLLSKAVLPFVNIVPKAWTPLRTPKGETIWVKPQYTKPAPK